MPFVPSARLAMLAVVPLLFGALTALEPWFAWPMLIADSALFLLAAADAWLGRRVIAEVKREPPRIFSVGRANPVRLQITTTARRPLVVQVNDDAVAALAIDDLPARVPVPATGHATVTYHVRPRARGLYELGDHHLRWATPLGLWQRQIRFPARDPVRVYPDVQAVRTYELLARQSLENRMVRTVRLRGGENEFEALRDYQRDDEYRAIDWKATARRQKLIAREYQQERNQSVLCMLDCGRLMTAETLGLSQLDHALNATLMLAHVATRAGDQVGMLAFDASIRAFLPPQGGRRAAQRVIAASYDIHAQVVETDFELAYAYLSHRLRKRSLVVLFTEVIDDVSARSVVRTMRGLGPRHLGLCVLFRDEALDAMAEPHMTADPARPEDLYQRAAAAEAIGWRDRLVRDLEEAGALVLQVAPAKLSPALINRYLKIKAERLL
jgi:uncharacterized protein (DUF58 family)